MVELTDIEIALENSDIEKIKEFVKTGGNIYKEFKKDYYYFANETLISRACRLNEPEIVEVLLEIYERDYKIAEKSVTNEEDKDSLLKFIFVARSDEEIKNVLELSQSKQIDSKPSIVLLADRNEAVLVSLFSDKNLLWQIYKNGLCYIGARAAYLQEMVHLVAKMNRLDLLKRMVKIGLKINCDDMEKVIENSDCVGLVKYYCLQFNLKNEKLLLFTSKCKSVAVFECVLEHVMKNSSLNKNDFLENYFKETPEYFSQCINYDLLAHLLIKYNIQHKDKYFTYLSVLKTYSSESMQKLLKHLNHNFDELVEALDSETRTENLYAIWDSIDKETLKEIKKNVVHIIIRFYTMDWEKSRQYENVKYFDMIDPLAIYDEENGNTALFIAMEHDCAPLIKHLISKGANLLHTNLYKQSTLIAACMYNSPEIITLITKLEPSLLYQVGPIGFYPLTWLITREHFDAKVLRKMVKRGADPNVVDITNNTLLHTAVIYENFDLAKLFLDLGVDPSIRGEHGNTALHLAADQKRLDIFELILNSGKFDIESKNYMGNTILHNVCKAYQPDFFFSLFEKTKPNVNALNNAGETPLSFCIDKDRYKKLLEMGADTSIVGGEDHMPFYSRAALYWGEELIEEVFSNPDIDFTVKNSDGRTVLHFIPSHTTICIDKFAKNENFLELIRTCTNVVTNTTKESALQFVAHSENLSLLKCMVEYGNPDLEYKNYLGETAIFGILKFHIYRKNALEYLIEKGIDVNAQNNDGNTILFESVYVEGTELVLKAGGLVNIANNNGETALHHAAKRNDLEMCLLLLKCGADLAVRDANNKTPADFCTYSHVKDFLIYFSK